MLIKNEERDIKKHEEAGIDVVLIDSDGKIDYATNSATGDEFCDHCDAFRLLPDPDPYDFFRDGDMKAVCLEVEGQIAGSLENPGEWTNIRKPLYCPKLGRELTEEEKEEAAHRLKWAKNFFKK